MDYDVLESELVNKLNAYLAATPVSDGSSDMLSSLYIARAMPENESEFTHAGEKGIANIHYADSQYTPPGSTGAVNQNERIVIVIYLQCRQLRGSGGAMRLISIIKSQLLGYKPTGARSRMFISNYGDWVMEGSETNPFIEFSFDTVNVQTDDSPAAIGGSLNSVTTVKS